MGKIYIIFDSNGSIVRTFSVDGQVRQGDLKKTTLVALIPTVVSQSMDGQLTIKRPDNKIGVDITMSEGAETYSGILYRSFSAFLDKDEWYTAKNGTAEAQVSFNTATGTILMHGTYTYEIEQTVYDEEPQITVTQYDELLTSIANKKTAYALDDVRHYPSIESLGADFGALAIGGIALYDFENYDSEVTVKVAQKTSPTAMNPSLKVDHSVKADRDRYGDLIDQTYLYKQAFDIFKLQLDDGRYVVGKSVESSYAHYKAGTDNKELATLDDVADAVSTMTAHYLTSDASGDNFPTKARLIAGPHYYAGQVHDPDQNDYAIVQNDETHDGLKCEYIYQNGQWDFKNDLPIPVASVEDVQIDGESIVENKVANINLDGKIIKEIPDEYVRIYDLDVGIYKLTFDGDKKIYYNGQRGQETFLVETKNPILIIDGVRAVYKRFSIMVDWNIDYKGYTYQDAGIYIASSFFGSVSKCNNNSSAQEIYAPTTSGADGQVLVSGGTNQAPQWANGQIIKTITEQNIRIWDLDEGTYWWVGTGTARTIYFSGTSDSPLGQARAYLNTNIGSVLLTITGTGTASSYKKFWRVHTGRTSSTVSFFGWTDATAGEYQERYDGSPIGKANNQSGTVAEIYAPTTAGSTDALVLRAVPNGAPRWDNLIPFTKETVIDLRVNTSFTLAIGGLIPELNGRTDVLIQVMPLSLIDEWVEKNVGFTEITAGFGMIRFNSDETLSDLLQVRITATVVIKK